MRASRRIGADNRRRLARLLADDLLGMEGRLRLHFERPFRDLPAVRPIMIACERSREHYRAAGGVLPIWGTIARRACTHRTGLNRSSLLAGD